MHADAPLFANAGHFLRLCGLLRGGCNWRRELFKADAPVRLIRDQDAKLEHKVPLVVLANGDVLNGLPRQLAAADGRQAQQQAHTT